MGFLKKEKRTAVSVQTQGGYPPVLPVTAGERALYRALREQVPIIDAAIYKLVRLIGGFEVYCPEKHTENALRGFLKTVPVNGCNMGIDNFLSVYFEQLLTYGNAIGEIVLANGEIRALYNASLEDLEIRLISPLETGVFVVRDGRAEPCRYPELILTSALNPMPGSAMGSSILKGLPFVSEVLLKIYRTVGINWERMGNVRFAVTCKNEGYMNAGDRAGQLAAGVSAGVRLYVRPRRVHHVLSGGGDTERHQQHGRTLQHGAVFVQCEPARFDARRSFRERLRNLHRNGGFNGERAGIRKHARDDCVHAGTRADSGGNVERLRAILPH